jgi:pimeloyl-ACP methyl ester carboxylesterase
MRELQLSHGTVGVSERGEGPPIVFVHGVLVNGDLWRDTIDRLAGQYRCIALTLPLGAHPTPMPPGADLSPTAIAGMVAEAIERLELDDVALVGSDTGGAICQLVVADHPGRIGRLALLSCDAYEHFPPTLLKPLCALARRAPRAVEAGFRAMRLRPVQTLVRLSVAKTSRPDLERGFFAPLAASAGVRRDLVEVLARANPSYTLAAVDGLRRFGRPALVAWADGELFFPRSDGERLARDLGGRFEVVDGSRTLVPLDRPDRTAELVESLMAEPAIRDGAAV